ncbi:MAG: glycosyltransferase family 1 protein [Ignavibacteriaceae bacterium]
MKKIGILAFVNKNAGGVLQYTQSLIDALIQDKSRDYVIFTDEMTDDINTYSLEVRKIHIPNPGFLIKLLSAVNLFLLIRKPFFGRVKKTVTEDIDLFICPRVIMYTQFFAEKPFVLTLHDLQELYYPDFFSLQERIIRFAVTRFLSRKAESIICESNYVKRDIIKFLKIDNNKIKVIPAPPPISFSNFKVYEEKEKIFKGKYSLPDEYLYYPASFWPHKNHIKLIKAFKIVSNLHPELSLVLSGAKHKNFPNVMNTIKDLKLQNRVLYTGYVDYDDLPYLYKLSKMLVMPSLFESISIPVYEAFALGIPVCCSNVVALPEQVGDSGLLFDPNNENDIADKIIKLLDDESLRTKIVNSGFNKIKAYSHINYNEKLVHLINSIL